ncbi:hypothetical protein D3C71_988680 [compost metagenome]
MRTLGHSNVLVSTLRVVRRLKHHGRRVRGQGIDGAVGIDGEDRLTAVVRVGDDRGVRVGQSQVHHLLDRCRVEKRGARDAEREVTVWRVIAMLELIRSAERSLGEAVVEPSGQIRGGVQLAGQLRRQRHAHSNRVRRHIGDSLQRRIVGNSGKRSADAVEIAVSVTAVRFHMGALGPFVPCIDNDEATILRQGPLGIIHQILEPCLEFAGRAVMHHQRLRSVPRRVVPLRHQAAEIGEVRDVGLVCVEVGDVVIRQDTAIDRAVGRQGSLDILNRAAGPVMKHAFRACIHSEILRIRGAAGKHCDHIGGRKAMFAALFGPHVEVELAVRYRGRPIDHQNRPVVDTDVSRILEERDQIVDEVAGVLRGIGLAEQDLSFIAIPAAGPILVRPAEAVGHLHIGIRQQHLGRILQDHLAGEPVVIEHLPMHAGFLHQLCLLAQRVRRIEHVVADVVMRDVLLIMAFEQGLRRADLGPFGESLAMPFVIQRRRMELRQVVGQDFDVLVDERSGVVLLDFVLAVVIDRILLEDAIDASTA